MSQATLMSNMEDAHSHGATDRVTAGPSGPVARRTIDHSAELDKRRTSSLANPNSISAPAPHHPSRLTFLELPAPSHIIYPNTSPHVQTTELDMPLLTLGGLLSLGGTEHAATGPSSPTASYMTFNESERAQSEPLPDRDEDVQMEPSLRHAHSEYSLSVADKRQTLSDSSDIAMQTTTRPSYMAPESRRPSPAPTEVDDPDQQDVMAKILSQGIKIRDFAYIQPATTSASPSSPLPPGATTCSVPFRPAPEIFDQYKGLAEVEFRWTQETRIYPIAGRTLRRLLDMGWIKQEEVDARAHPVDLEELARHDALPVYPWRPFRCRSIPCMEQRKDITNARRLMFRQLDRIRAVSEAIETRRQIEEAKADITLAELERKIHLREMAQLKAQSKRMDQVVKEMREQEALSLSRPLPFRRNKRRLGDIAEGHSMPDNDEKEGQDVHASAKKRRVTPENSSTDEDQFQFQSQLPFSSQRRHFIPPEKQYPAPLHSYDPEIYPEAASIIESSSQSQSQPRPVVPQRIDTPPLDDEEGSSSQQDRSPGKRGQKLVHPRERKAMKRALSRTQTFAQL